MHQTFVHNPAYPLPQELLPHRPPMMLISGIVNADESQLCAYAKIGEEHHLFLNEKKEASNALLLELMAQCVGCWAGLRERTLTGGKPRIGFLLGTRSFSCRARPLLEGETVQLKSRCSLSAMRLLERKKPHEQLLLFINQKIYLFSRND